MFYDYTKMKKQKNCKCKRLNRSGFTLIEAALTTVIVGTGVLAIVSAQQAFHKENLWAQRSATGMVLANELRELTLTMPMHDPVSNKTTLGPEPNEASYLDFDDIDDFSGDIDEDGVTSGITFDPPINALRLEIEDLEGWSQKVEIGNVFENDISTTFTQPIGTTELMRVTVTVYYQRPNVENAKINTITQLSWVIDK